MLELAQLTEAFLERAGQAPGGFCWWYADLTTSEGDGLVLIWSLGLPFLAGQREAGPAVARPALNLAIYKGGRSEFYLLQEHDADACSFGEPRGSAQLGLSRIDVQCEAGRLLLRAELDEPIPGTRERVQGWIELEGPELELGGAPSAAAHIWSPRVIHGRAQARLDVGARHWELAGHGYFDGNASPIGLHAQGIEVWRWGRISNRKSTLVFYEVEAEPSHGAETRRFVLEADGTGCRLLPKPVLVFGQEKAGLYGMRAPRELTVGSRGRLLACKTTDLLDDGPFYQRFALQGADASGPVRGFYEVVRPARLDRPWQRPFVRMRTHVVRGPNSFWLPLFSGPRAGRASRLLGTWRLGR